MRASQCYGLISEARTRSDDGKPALCNAHAAFWQLYITQTNVVSVPFSKNLPWQIFSHRQFVRWQGQENAIKIWTGNVHYNTHGIGRFTPSLHYILHDRWQCSVCWRRCEVAATEQIEVCRMLKQSPSSTNVSSTQTPCFYSANTST